MLGPALLLLSLVWYFHPQWPVTLVTYYAFEATFSLGLLLTFSRLVTAWGGVPLIRSGRLTQTYLLGVACGFFLELFSNWLFKTWIYPPLSLTAYLANIFFFHGLYFLILYEGYRAALLFVRTVIPAKPIPAYRGYERTAFPIIGLAGTLTLSWLCVDKAHTAGPPAPWEQTLNLDWASPATLLQILLMCLSLWFAVEGLAHLRKTNGLLLSLLRGNTAPLFALILASAVTSLAYERYNLPLGLWRYLNLPHSPLVFGIPALVLALWPVQYVYFISLDHILHPKETADIWD